MPTHSTAAAVAEGVSYRFANGVVALNQVSAVVEPGTITALIGRNGSGKTTLLRILAGLLPVKSGTVRILGESLHPPSPDLRGRLSYVSQSTELDSEMTTAETLALFAALYGVRDAEARIGQFAADFGLAEHLSRMVALLSGGLRQRLHLAVGLLHEPQLLLLDEPTAALDPDGRAFVWNLLEQRRARGNAIVVITHDLAEAAAHCQEVMLLQRGTVLAAGPPATLTAAHGADLSAAYFQITGEKLEWTREASRGHGAQRSPEE